MPPIADPPMYRPIARPIVAVSTSSATNAIATAGMPASAIPVATRIASSAGQFGAVADSRVNAPAASSEPTIIGRRPTRSDTIAATTSISAIGPVAREMTRLALAASTAKSCVNSGNIGCGA